MNRNSSRDESHHLRQELGVKITGMDKVKPLTSFSDLGFYSKFRKDMDRQEWLKPTPIQSYAIPIILSNRHLIGVSSTGSGKTLAYVLPLTYLMRQKKETAGSRVLVLAPTRELAKQISGEFRKLVGDDVGCVYGGVPMRAQSRDISKRVVVATPGRFMGFLNWGKINTQFDFVVIDQADRLLEGTFLEDLELIFKSIGQYQQISLFSATITKDVQSVARKFMTNAVRLTIGGNTSFNRNITQQIIEIHRKDDRINEVIDILSQFRNDKCLIFCNTKAVVNDVYNILYQRTRVTLDYIHGDVPQDTRERIIKDFRSGRVRVLVATDVASRGLDIAEIKIVINFHFPKDLKTYTHRIGRTARYNRKGLAISFVGRQSSDLMYELVDFMIKCRQKVPEFLFRQSGFNPKRKQELEISLAQIELPEEVKKLEPIPREEKFVYVEKKQKHKSESDDEEQSFRVKPKSTAQDQKSSQSSDKYQQKIEEFDKVQDLESSFRKKKVQQNEPDPFLNLSFRKKQQSMRLEQSKIFSDKKTFLEQDHAKFKRQRFDLRKYKPSGVSLTIGMKDKSLTVAFGKFEENEGDILVIGRSTKGYEDVKRMIKDCGEKKKASNSAKALQEAEEFIKEKALKTIKVEVVSNYDACLFINAARIKKDFLWKAAFHELQENQAKKVIIAMPIRETPEAGDEIGEALKQISSELNEASNVSSVTLMFANPQLAKQWVEVMMEKKMI